MCNKQLETEEDIKINMKDHQLQAIDVDNDCFYSDHVITRRADILTAKEARLAQFYALPHEFEHKKNVDKKDYKSDDDDSQVSKTWLDENTIV